MNILSYDQNTFKDKYSNEFVIGFERAKLSKGPIDLEQTHLAIKQINEKIVSEAPSITFEAVHIAEELQGGACSAISLQIAAKALDSFPQCSSFETLVEKIKTLAEELNTMATKENATCKKERTKIRSLQAAYNTITVNATEKTTDIAQEKIKALVSYFDLKVQVSSETLEVRPNDACSGEFTKTMDKLKNGVYLVRGILSGTSEEAKRKQELHGHSTVYIKHSEGKDLYFDPNLGLYDLSKHPESRQIIFQMQCALQAKHHMETCRYHKLEKNNKDQA